MTTERANATSTPSPRFPWRAVLPALVGAASGLAADGLIELGRLLPGNADWPDEINLAMPALTLFVGVLVLDRADFAPAALSPLWPRFPGRALPLLWQAVLIWGAWRLAVDVAESIHDVRAANELLSMLAAGLAAGAIGGAGMVLAVPGAARARPPAVAARSIAVAALLGAVLLAFVLKTEAPLFLLTAPWQAAVLTALLAGAPRRAVD